MVNRIHFLLVSAVTLSGGTMRGFLIQARMPGNAPGNGVDPMLLGSFTPTLGTQNLNCDLVNNAATTVRCPRTHTHTSGGSRKLERGVKDSD